ncbi:hypothetical protein AGMMS49975_21490 [Clostridia bacterium]|nr:hypothetical protein AGMMS49975_21490 [Clostridia bacterium]
MVDYKATQYKHAEILMSDTAIFSGDAGNGLFRGKTILLSYKTETTICTRRFIMT